MTYSFLLNIVGVVVVVDDVVGGGEGDGVEFEVVGDGDLNWYSG